MPVALILLVVLEASPVTDPVTLTLLNYGAFGAVILLLIFGKLHTHSEVLALQKQIDTQNTSHQQLIDEKNHDIERQRQIIEAVQLQITGHALPALRASAQVIESIPSSGSVLFSEVQKIAAQVESLSQQITDLRGGGASNGEASGTG